MSRELPAAVAEQARRGDGWVKLVGDWIDRGVGDLAPLWSDDVLVDAIAAAHAEGARVTAHVFGEDAFGGLIAAGIDCIEHGTGITDDVIAMMLERGTALVPTLINIENFPGIADAAEKDPTYAKHMRDLYATCHQRVGAAYEAGVPIYAGTDAGGMIAHGRIADEVDALKTVGMSPTAAWAPRAGTPGRGWAARPRAWRVGRPGLLQGRPADRRRRRQRSRTRRAARPGLSLTPYCIPCAINEFSAATEAGWPEVRTVPPRVHVQRARSSTGAVTVTVGSPAVARDATGTGVRSPDSLAAVQYPTSTSHRSRASVAVNSATHCALSSASPGFQPHITSTAWSTAPAATSLAMGLRGRPAVNSASTRCMVAS